MSWDIRTLKEMEKEFIKQFMLPGANKAEVCRMFGISRKTGYKWLKRYQTEGDAGLRERSQRPLSKSVQEEETITRIVEIRVKHPSWGSREGGRKGAGGVDDRFQRVVDVARWEAEVLPKMRQKCYL